MSEYARAFYTALAIDLVIAIILTTLLVSFIWHRRQRRLRQENRQLSHESVALRLQAQDKAAEAAEAMARADRLAVENQEVRAALTMAEVKLSERGLRPIDELAWEARLESAQIEIRQLKQALRADASADPERLQQISGIGDVFAQRLQAAGVRTFAQLAVLSADEIRAIVQAAEWQAIDPDAWIAQARALAGLDDIKEE